MDKTVKELQSEFESLCDKQDRLYRPDFEAVFKALYEIDNEQKDIYNTHVWNMGNTLPDEAEKDKLQKALQEAGFWDDEDFCNDFCNYCNTTIQGKKLTQQMYEIYGQKVEPHFKQEENDVWRFKYTYIILFSPIHFVDCMNNPVEIVKTDLLCIDGTNIPEEDEEEDEYLMIDAYNCRASFEYYIEELKSFKVIGNENAMFGKDYKRLLLRILRGCAMFMKENTDKPAAVKNQIISVLKILDGIYCLGLLLQILTLQGLCRYMEGVNINEGDNGYREAQCLYDWLQKVLIDKLIQFIYTPPASDKDKEALRPLCDYLYSTTIGRAVQKRIFGEPQQQENDKKSTDGFGNLPEELNTDKAKMIFSKAVKTGLMQPARNGRCYQWNKSNALLAYLCGKIYCGDSLEQDAITQDLIVKRGNCFFPETALMALFVNKEQKHIMNLGQSRLQLTRPPKGYENVERLYE